jgi:GR25 family glycosyltransferase involved in LPS biosynthesis
MSQIPPPEISYYLIHNGEEKRLVRMLSQFDKYGLDISKINMIITPNKDDLTPDIINRIVQTQPSISNNNPIKPEYLLSRRGLVVCGYKHYLALKDAAEKNTEYTVIMEDNAEYTENVFAMLPTYIQQLNTVYNGEWDILFNCINNEWGRYIYQPIKPGLFVYPKSNEINHMCAGSTKSARFYLIRREFARRLSNVFLPFNNGPDLWMNDLFRQLGARSFWVEPANVAVERNHKSSTECLC